MDTKIHCRYCRSVVGVADDRAREHGQVRLDFYPTEHCYGEHQKPVEFTRVHCFGLVNDVRIFYPETDSEEKWSVYIGPRNHFLVWLALHSVPGSLRVGDEPLCWSPRMGFFGPGYGKLFVEK